MLWWIGAVAAGIAALRFFGDGSSELGWLSALIAVAGLWTAGIAANFGPGREQQIPSAAARINMLATLSGIVVLIISFVIL